LYQQIFVSSAFINIRHDFKTILHTQLKDADMKWSIVFCLLFGLEAGRAINLFVSLKITLLKIPYFITP